MHESQPQYLTSVEGDDVGKAKGCVGKCVGFLVGAPESPPLTQVPLWHIPKGTELQDVESGKDCEGGQLPSGLHDVVISQSLSFPQEHSCVCACL